MRTSRTLNTARPQRDDRLRQALRRNAAGASGLLMIGSVAALAAALATWSVNDPSWSHATEEPVRNALGTAGAVVADLVMQLIGLASAVFLIPVTIWGWHLVFGRRIRVERLRFLSWVIAIALAAGCAAALPVPDGWALPSGLGGVLGDGIFGVPESILGGSVGMLARFTIGIAFGVLALVLMVHASGIGPGATTPRVKAAAVDMDDDDEDESEETPGRFGAMLGLAAHGWLSLKAAAQRHSPFRREPSIPGVTDIYDDEEDEDPVRARPRPKPVARVAGWWRDLTQPDDGLDALVPGDGRDGPYPDEPPFGVDEEEEGMPLPPPVAQAYTPLAAHGPVARTMPPAPPLPPGPAAVRVTPAAPPPKQSRRLVLEAQPSLLAVNEFDLPPLTLLTEPKPLPGKEKVSPESLAQNARLLEGVLEDFGVKGEIVNVRPGPVVTLYELEPAPGIKSSRVIGLADDIARSMSAIAARVAVIPGKNAIGIELPNQRRETVFLRELVASQEFDKSKGRLALALGKTIGGEPVIVDLARTPHMLVAGTTGSGKSVSINTMILSLVYRLTPEQCRLIMIDPKMLELSVYDGIPHLLSPVVTDPRKAVVALKWTVREMEDRYKKMSKVGVRNIDGFNLRVAEAMDKGESISRTVQTGFDKATGEPVFETEEMDLKPLPYIVVIIDEMADLMMVAGKDIEGAVQRLAQMARAAGIHVIMATQRPSVDVITGTIKANFPTRVSFQVTSKIDSRTILGEQGAEQLLGQGDMLYMAGGGRIQRVHGPFVSDAEVEAIVAHLKTQGMPDYLEAITSEDDEDGEVGSAGGDAGSFGEEGGDLYGQAVAVVIRDKKVSTSYIQRRLGIGYNRAASIIERMEKEGVVGAANHAGKREILVGGAQDEDY
jgi:S-DNA-T family DNA segregation ATPase FtsK/SpoIIIE